MALEADPYRILELPRGASIDEVKRAYRRLAKANHPDAAGEAALPRFLAIQAAYEQLVDGVDAPGRSRRGAGAPRRAWDADPDRSDATRRAYGGRPRNAPPRANRTSPGGSGPAPGTNGPNGTTGGADTAGAAPDGTARPGGARQASGRAGPAAGRTSRRRSSQPRGGSGAPPNDGSGPPPNDGSSQPPNAKRSKATLGSTSYDGAADGPFEPDWGGASWYGTTSGTYWTLNPKEYADPRKHGPEYQARARRAARARSPDADPTDPGVSGPAPGPAGTDAGAATPGAGSATAGAGSPEAAASATHSTTSWWDSTTGPPGPDPGASARDGDTPAGGRSRSDRRRPPPAAEPPPPDLGRAAADITRALTDERYGGLRGRVIRAAIGWLPIAIGIGWVFGEVTGCGRFAATCDGSAEPFVLLLQVGAFGLLLLFPVLASVATTAAVTLFVAAVIAALIVSATGGAADAESRRATLGAVLLIAWFAGIAIAVMRRIRSLPSPTRPVS